MFLVISMFSGNWYVTEKNMISGWPGSQVSYCRSFFVSMSQKDEMSAGRLTSQRQEHPLLRVMGFLVLDSTRFEKILQGGLRGEGRSAGEKSSAAQGDQGSQ